MKIDIPFHKLWFDHNTRLQKMLSIQSQGVVKSYPSLSFSLSEIVRGLVQLFPHRKNYALVKGVGPYFDELAKYLSMQGLVATELEVANLREAPSQIPKDCLLVLASFDDPMTGELFGIDELLSLVKNRTFTVFLSHSYHLFKSFPELTPYSAFIFKNEGFGATALLGQRASKIQPLALGLNDWLVDDLWKSEIVQRLESKTEILEFETNLPQPFKAFFSDKARLFDRCVFYSEEFDGEAVLELLCEELQISLRPPGCMTMLETLSRCRWQGDKIFDWLLIRGQSASILRGTVILDAQLAKKATLEALGRVTITLRSLGSPQK